jgi:ATP-dependent protease HslVU (ClpYQ) peptidase subunit
MTTIIGVQLDNQALIVSDSLVTDDSGHKYHHPVMEKVRQNGPFLIAGAGEVAPCDIAMHIWKPPSLTTKDKKDIYHFVIAKAMPSLRKCLIENGYDFSESDSKKDETRFSFIMAVGGELFDVDDDLSVMRHNNGYYGIGSGANYAIGALYAGADPVRAVEIACELNAFSAPPITEYKQYKY